MNASDRILSDPRDEHWGDLDWSPWHALDRTGAGVGLVPTERGIYRLRCRGQPELIYVGISDRLRRRISRLRNGTGHSAAPCVQAHARHAIIEVSWATVGRHDTEEANRRELLGLEADLIAACRRVFGHSPACQFHGRPLE